MKNPVGVVPSPRLKSIVHNAANRVLPAGWHLNDAAAAPDYVELGVEARSVVREVVRRRLSMTSAANLAFTSWACRYVVESDVPGDFLEVGTWRGGHGVIAGRTLRSLGAERKVWLADSFTGMLEHSERDVNIKTGVSAAEWKRRAAKGDSWKPATAEDVAENLVSMGIPKSGFHLLEGPAEQLESCQLPNPISVLRVDVDWYEPTLATLVAAQPLLAEGAVIIFDDYGAWQGAKLAVDEFLGERGGNIPMFPIDASARFVVWPGSGTRDE